MSKRNFRDYHRIFGILLVTFLLGWHFGGSLINGILSVFGAVAFISFYPKISDLVKKLFGDSS